MIYTCCLGAKEGWMEPSVLKREGPNRINHTPPALPLLTRTNETREGAAALHCTVHHTHTSFAARTTKKPTQKTGRVRFSRAGWTWGVRHRERRRRQKASPPSFTRPSSPPPVPPSLRVRRSECNVRQAIPAPSSYRVHPGRIPLDSFGA